MESKIKKELKLVSVEKSYNSLKVVAIISILGCAMFFSIAYIYLNLENKELSNRILYMDSNGMIGTGEVKSMNDKDVLLIQLKASVKYAIPFLYSFNSSNFDEQIEKGLKLFGEPGKIIYSNYMRDNVKEKVISSGLIVDCIIKSAEIEENENGTFVNVSFDQSFTSGGSVKTRSITARASLSRVKISNTNPFGFIITEWIILNEER